jgi:hypothetical protein
MSLWISDTAFVWYHKGLEFKPIGKRVKIMRVLYNIGFAFEILPIACHLGQLTWVLTSVRPGYLLWWVKPTTGSSLG